MKKLLTLFLMIGVLGAYWNVASEEIWEEKNIIHTSMDDINNKLALKYFLTLNHNGEIINDNKWNLTLGYSLAYCLRGEDFNEGPEWGLLNIWNWDDKWAYWLNIFEVGSIFNYNNYNIEVGIGYGKCSMRGGSYVFFKDEESTYWQYSRNIINPYKYYLFFGGKIDKNMILGAELNFSRINALESHYNLTNPGSDTDTSFITRMDFWGCGMYFKLYFNEFSNEKIGLSPFLVLKIAGSNEIHNDSRSSDYFKNTVMIWYSGIYLGFNFNLGM
ncbi:MAG: hypothetical protein AB7T10_00950 [bacterium]